MNVRLVPAIVLTVGLHFLSGCSLLKADPHIASLGDSIFEAWWYPSANLGHHGDTVARMLARFPLVVPGHGYTTVVLMGGSNDVLLGIDPETTIQNLETLGPANPPATRRAGPLPGPTYLPWMAAGRHQRLRAPGTGIEPPHRPTRRRTPLEVD